RISDVATTLVCTFVFTVWLGKRLGVDPSYFQILNKPGRDRRVDWRQGQGERAVPQCYAGTQRSRGRSADTRKKRRIEPGPRRQVIVVYRAPQLFRIVPFLFTYVLCAFAQSWTALDRQAEDAYTARRSERSMAIAAVWTS